MNRASSSTTAPLLTVYDGRACVGFILSRGRAGFEAFTADEKSRGLFATQQDATAALEIIAEEQGR
jgi:hypothetical protein